MTQNFDRKKFSSHLCKRKIPETDDICRLQWEKIDLRKYLEISVKTYDFSWYSKCHSWCSLRSEWKQLPTDRCKSQFKKLRLVDKAFPKLAILGYSYIATKSSVVNFAGYSSNWHKFCGILKDKPLDLDRITLLMIDSKSPVEQTAGKHIPIEILGPISRLINLHSED